MDLFVLFHFIPLDEASERFRRRQTNQKAQLHPEGE